MGECQILAENCQVKVIRGLKVPMWIELHSLHQPEKSSVIIAAALLRYCFPEPCYRAALTMWRRFLEARVEPDPLLRFAMSSLTHVPWLCVLPSASGGCPSPPWERRQRQTQRQSRSALPTLTVQTAGLTSAGVDSCASCWAALCWQKWRASATRLTERREPGSLGS